MGGGVAAIGVARACHVEAETKFATVVGEGQAAVERRIVRALACAAGVAEVGAAWEQEGSIRVGILNLTGVSGLVVVSTSGCEVVAAGLLSPGLPTGRVVALGQPPPAGSIIVGGWGRGCIWAWRCQGSAACDDEGLVCGEVKLELFPHG